MISSGSGASSSCTTPPSASVIAADVLPPFREVISAYQKCIAETVQRFGGFVAKYMGDGVLVYFGYPQAHEDDAERAVRAGLELVIGTSTNTQRRARLEEFGCALALDSNNPSWPEQARKATADNGVDVIVDMISGSVADQNLQAAAVLGRIVNVGRLGGITSTFNFELHAFKRRSPGRQADDADLPHLADGA